MHQILMIFVQMLEIVVLSDLASGLCARKFSFAPQGSVPQIALLSFIIIIILLLFFIIFKALRLAAVVFMCFFKFGRRRETSALRACYL